MAMSESSSVLPILLLPQPVGHAGVASSRSLNSVPLSPGAVVETGTVALAGAGSGHQSTGSLPAACAALAGCVVVWRNGARRRRSRSSDSNVICWAVETTLKADEAVKVARGKARTRQEGQSMRSEEEYARYRIEFAAKDAPEWQAATILSAELLPTGDRLVDIEVEVSRQKVPLEHAYRMPGQRLRLRLPDAAEQDECELVVASPPPSLADNHQQLMNLKGDIFAGSTKSAIDVLGQKVILQAVLPKNSDIASKLADSPLPLQVEAGPFAGSGLNILPLAPVFRNRALLLLCEESFASICSLRALVESADSASDLQLWHREGVLLMQFAAKDQTMADSVSKLLDDKRLDEWEDNRKVRALRVLGDIDDSVSDCIQNFLQVKGVEAVSAGALVLGSPEFTRVAIQRLTEDLGVERSQVVCSIDEAVFAEVVDPEQI